MKQFKYTLSIIILFGTTATAYSMLKKTNNSSLIKTITFENIFNKLKIVENSKMLLPIVFSTFVQGTHAQIINEPSNSFSINIPYSITSLAVSSVATCCILCFYRRCMRRRPQTDDSDEEV